MPIKSAFSNNKTNHHPLISSSFPIQLPLIKSMYESTLPKSETIELVWCQYVYDTKMVAYFQNPAVKKQQQLH